LGIGDWAQSPIPNPQSPIPNLIIYLLLLIQFEYKYYKYKNKIKDNIKIYIIIKYINNYFILFFNIKIELSFITHKLL